MSAGSICESSLFPSSPCSGLFYISTFIDASDKLFKGVATGAMVTQLLVYKTPQFVYFVIPIAALLSVLVTFGTLSRTSELTVMKACGVSLYRVAVPVVLLSLAWSAALFALDQDSSPVPTGAPASSTTPSAAARPRPSAR